MRTVNSVKNIASTLSLTLIMSVLGFMTRKYFVDTIGVQYLGLNGLLSNILGMVTLIEGGFGASIMYNLYKPLAVRDKPTIIALFQLYRKIYAYVTLGIFLISLCIYPFLGNFIKNDGDLSYVSIVFFIFVFNSLVQYFSASRWSIINADQKEYKLTLMNYIYQIGLNLTKILILVYTENYILYLVVESVFGLTLALGIIRKVNKLYPYICTKKKYAVSPEIKKNITTNVKAIFLQSLGGYFYHSTDNIIISSFVSISMVGLYSNYSLITGMISSFINQIMNGFSSSIANMIAISDKEKSYGVFKSLFFINFILISWAVIMLGFTLNPFITWWLGQEYILPWYVLAVVLLNFYILGMRHSASIFKIKSGIFTQDRYSPLLQGVINLIFSLILVKPLGITGVFLGSTISVLAIGFWQFPRLVYKYTFQLPLWKYFRQYIIFTLTAAINLSICYLILDYIALGTSILSILTRWIIITGITIPLYYLVFRKNEEFVLLLQYVILIKGKLMSGIDVLSVKLKESGIMIYNYKRIKK